MAKIGENLAHFTMGKCVYKHKVNVIGFNNLGNREDYHKTHLKKSVDSENSDPHGCYEMMLELKELFAGFSQKSKLSHKRILYQFNLL